MKPTADSTISEIKAYLDAHGVSYPSSAVKADLLAHVESVEEQPDNQEEPEQGTEGTPDGSKEEEGEKTPDKPQTPEEARAATKYTKRQLIDGMSFPGSMRDLLKISLKDGQLYTYSEAMDLVEQMKGNLF